MNESDESKQTAAPAEAPADSRARRISPVTAARLIVCGAAAAAAVMIKVFGGGFYESARSVYEEYAVRSLVIENESSNEAFLSSAKNDFQSR